MASLKIADDIKTLNEILSKKTTYQKISFKNSLELKNISFKYKNRGNMVLDNLNLVINKGTP